MYYHHENGYKLKKETAKNFVLIVALLALFLANTFQYFENRSLGVEVEKARAEALVQEKVVADLNFRLAEKNALLSEAERELIALQTGRKNRINLLAVVNGEGVTIPVESEIRRGEGRLLLDVGGTLYLAETQLSISSAAEAAKTITGSDLADKDVIIRVENPYAQALALSGESAGTSFAVAIIANLQGRSIRDDILLTGAINPDGSIGVVGDVPIKALAARDAKATTLLVPRGQGVEVEGVRVVEVSDIEQALKVMLE
jgi:predicted ATP-dependent protease